MRLRAPAKLNLTLEVLDRRPDGLHNLRSLMVPVDLCDELEIEPHAGGFEFICDRPELAAGNLVERAVRALDLPSPDWRITLRKAIPVGSGMGGGSSDAAAVLAAAQGGAFGSLGTRDYLAIARSLGSDVPFFLVRTGALVESAGERVTAVGALPPWHAVIVAPPIGISTAQAYADLDARPKITRPRSGSVTLQALAALQRAEFERVNELLSNDFEAVALQRSPEVGIAIAALRAAGTAHPIMSGSGSCVYALAPSSGERDALARGLSLPPRYRVYSVAFDRADDWKAAA